MLKLVTRPKGQIVDSALEDWINDPALVFELAFCEFVCK